MPYLEFFAIIGGPRYLGYRTITTALEPFVEQVAGAVHLMGGKISTHISLWVPLWDSMVRPWG
jgi:hypothetical protein